MVKQFVGVLALVVAASTAAAQEPELGVGSKAPAIQVAKWVKGGPISEFEPGKTYVVEFWATWCGPCRVSIPHLTELQKEYEGKGVEVIGVSVFENDYEGVEPFVQQMGDQMDYNVAIDQTDAGQRVGAMGENWMQAAGQGGIPTAFIVKEGTIQWIGHPMTMDEPLAAVVAGTYDIEAAKAEAAAAKAMEAKMAVLAEKFQALPDGDVEAQIALLDEAIADEKMLEEQLGFVKFNLLLQAGKTEPAVAYGKSLAEGPLKDNPQALNAIAWTLVDPASPVKTGKAGGQAAVAIATRAVEMTKGESPDVLDTLARAHFQAGDAAKALEYQKKAVELAGDENPELKQRLDEYKKAAAGSGK